MQGYIMWFPIIRVKDSATGHIHIVGTNSHDTLYIDDSTGGIQYRNLQKSEATGGGDYEFVGEDNEYSPYPEIEFVDFDELLETYKEQVHISAEREKLLREHIKLWASKYAEEVKKSKEQGIIHT